jgi:hypothetical protein
MSSVTQRLRALAVALGAPADTAAAALPAVIAEHAGAPAHDVSYLVLAAIAGEIPRPGLVKPFTRRWRLDGLETLVRERRAAARLRPVRLPIRIVEGPTVIDVTDTLSSTFTTGIQRVARETIARWWEAEHELILARWDPRGHRLIALDADAVRHVIPGAGPRAAAATEAILIPFRTPFVLPEISVSLERTTRLRTIARYFGGRSTAIGFDCIPITSSETTGAGMPGAFSKYLAALARFTTIAPISDASATEYRGWRRMLAGTGIAGPLVTTLELPFTTSGVSDPDRAALLREQLALGDDPIVLCVGSHEPRKNHLSLLHAAEHAWRAGEKFTLVLVGGNSWDTERFDRLVAYLRRRDRRIVTLSGVGDDVIWDLYDLARFSVFCSLNEGFGLPVVESLDHGTPVITSDFGSMRTLGAGHGALLVDPVDIDQLSDAILRILRDDELYQRLRDETATIPETSWESYSAGLWSLTAE